MVISVVTASVALTLSALVAIAYMLGWLPSAASMTTPAGMASPGQQAAGTAPGVALLPGESIVTPETQPAPAPAARGPSTPNYARGAPGAAPVPRDSTAAPVSRNPTAAPLPAPVPRDPRPELTSRPPAPKTPSYARAGPGLGVCVNCGIVTATTAYADTWEVRVRFEDGSTQTRRFRTPPEFRIGQRVRLEDDRLVRD